MRLIFQVALSTFGGRLEHPVMKKTIQTEGRVVPYELRNDRPDSLVKCLGYEVTILSEKGKAEKSWTYEGTELRWAREGYKTLIDAQARGMLDARAQWKPYKADSRLADGSRIVRKPSPDGPERTQPGEAGFRTTARALILAAFFCLWAVKAHAQMDIYIFAGQSNMQGQAPLAGEPAPQHGDQLMMMYTPSGQWMPAKDPTSAYPGSGVGPALWATDRLASYYPGRTIGIVNASKGGTALWEWSPNYASHSLYGNMIRLAKEASQYGTVRGFFWYQGEDEGDTADDVHEYGPRMYVLFNAVRQDLGVPIVFVQLGPDPHWYARPYWADIQIVQGWIGQGAPDWLKMVTAMDLSAAGQPFPQEHLNQQSQIILGGRMADAMYLLLSGQAGGPLSQN
jgi:hypothetical protein